MEAFVKYWQLLWDALYALFKKVGIDFMYKTKVNDKGEYVKDEEF